MNFSTLSYIVPFSPFPGTASTIAIRGVSAWDLLSPQVVPPRHSHQKKDSSLVAGQSHISHFIYTKKNAFAGLSRFSLVSKVYEK
jgi:hypothetical protein